MNAAADPDGSDELRQELHKSTERVRRIIRKALLLEEPDRIYIEEVVNSLLTRRKK